jgi:hypothetical protein
MKMTSRSYLTGRNKLQWPERSLQIPGIALQVIESIGERGLKFGRAPSRRGAGSDLVKSSHVSGFPGVLTEKEKPYSMVSAQRPKEETLSRRTVVVVVVKRSSGHARIDNFALGQGRERKGGEKKTLLLPG